ncbi:hypothetical protein M413DRAFT_14650 [Hebeloma cylindrosporum]|uniref:Uncharacterized protein n=1 Tax=Hebeloma cylindrosporum TaxID=76867 RepID=A0A0C3BEM8_HEBCY|nr:hypothetical protein M413DRAFT_14650 [Hebeloma cylindrosporum h7]
MSVADFCRRAQELRDEDDAKFVKFVLTGKDGQGQAVVDPILDRVKPTEEMQLTRDYDSLLGMCPDIKVHGSLTVYPLAKRDDTLTRNTHFTYRFQYRATSLDIAIHKVPNICLGKWGTHNMLRAFIPGLYTEERGPQLTQDEQRMFYEDGLLPAIAILSPVSSTEWSPSYDDLMFAARRENGQLAFHTKVVPPEVVADLADQIRANLEDNGHRWGRGLVILHQIRGVKESTMHSVSYAAGDQAIIAFLRDHQLLKEDDDDTWTLTEAPNSSWYVDTGLQVASKQGRCLQWRTDGQCDLVARVCRLPEHKAISVTTPGSKSYTRDMASHLPAVSGCRIVFSKRAQTQGEYATSYLQMYTTEKSLIYNPDKGHFGKYVTCEQILKGKGDNFAENLFHLYLRAIRNNYSLARLEVRIPLEFATDVFQDFDRELIQSSLLSFDPNAWWSVRFLCSYLFFF